MNGLVNKIMKKDNLEYEFLPPALEIVETPASPIKRALIWIILLIAVLTFLWSYFGRVDEVAVARGKIIPDGHIKVIQPLEAGIIRAIHVKEGQRVKTGQVLIELDPTMKQADVESTEKTLSINLADKEMLMAELQNTEIVNPEYNEFFELQKKLKEARESEYDAKEEALRRILSQKKNELRSAEAILIKIEKTFNILMEQDSAFKNLYEKGFLAKMDYLEKQIKLTSVEQDLEAQRRIVQQVENGLKEKEMNLEALKQERTKEILKNIVETEKTIISFRGEVRKARKRYELEKLTSPVDGTVHGLGTYTIGGIVTPAQPIVTIVPDGTALIVEAMVLNRDIGFLKVGQEAEVKLDTFPFQKYGTIKGRVEWLSPDVVEDEKLGAVYKMKVEVETHDINLDGRMVSITPGMALSVEVKTGKRRIIEFFLSPLIKYTKESLILR